MKYLKSILLLLCCSLFCACGKQEQFSSSPMQYADLLRIQEKEGWTEVEVLDAWHQGKLLQRYLLVPRGDSLPDDLPAGTLVRTPLMRVVAFSSVHGGLFCELECADQMVGMCDVAYIQSDSLRRRLADCRLLDAGSAMQMDLERLGSFRPDAFFVSPFENAGYGGLSALQVPLIECADYMETSALGRAEWVKFYGRLMGCAERADRLFAQVEREYLQLCEQVNGTVERPSLICDMKQGSAWYVPGGDSYIGRLLVDAGADYLFSEKETSGSVPLSFENVYAKGHDADVWVIKYGQATSLTYARLAADNPLYAHFLPWKQQRIFGCNTFSTPFYEEIPFHPERFLKDMVKILHPELLPDYQLQYYHPLTP